MNRSFVKIFPGKYLKAQKWYYRLIFFILENCKSICKLDDFKGKQYCGTDGKTYENECELKIKVCEGEGKEVEMNYPGKCDSGKYQHLLDLKQVPRRFGRNSGNRISGITEIFVGPAFSLAHHNFRKSTSKKGTSY